MIWVEQWLDLSRWYGEEGGGTADAITLRDRVAKIVDLKDGVSPVYPDTPQLKIYGLGALKFLTDQGIDTAQIDEVHLVIVQPKVSKEPLVHVMTVTELIQWGHDVLKPGAQATRDPDAPRIPGEKQCRWCKAAGICPEKAQANAVTIYGGAARVDEFPTYGAPPVPATMTNDTLAAILDKQSMVEAWLKAVRAEAERRALDGQDVPGYKVVRGKRGNRQWAAGMESEIAAVLKGNYQLANETIYKLEMLTPTQILKLPAVKENPSLLDTFITQSEGGVGLAPVSDKRPALAAGEVTPVIDAFTVYED